MKGVLLCYRGLIAFMIVIVVVFAADVVVHCELDDVTSKHQQLVSAGGLGGVRILASNEVDDLLRPVSKRQWAQRLSALSAEMALKDFDYHVTQGRTSVPDLSMHQIVLTFDAPTDLYAYRFFSALPKVEPGWLSFDSFDMERARGDALTPVHVRATLSWLTNPIE
ncbi:MAG: hypothetical protein JO126_00755 [Alphaproteobacteria bacterium]|nr:hypothetical protein [Alphaproteobacteria bacterium]